MQLKMKLSHLILSTLLKLRHLVRKTEIKMQTSHASTKHHKICYRCLVDQLKYLA